MMALRILALIFLAHSITCTKQHSQDFSREHIANTLKEQASLNRIDSRIIYTIAKIESNFTPLVISFRNKTKKLSQDLAFLNTLQKNGLIAVRAKNYGAEHIISIFSQDKNILELIASDLIRKHYLIDVGLMQINSQNFTLGELSSIFHLDVNIQKSIDFLRVCQRRFQTLKDTIECYNKGFTKKRRYDYYTRFKTSFINDFTQANNK